MFKSYLEVALRNLATQKLYSAINVIGLAVGLACVILIALYVHYELSYDRQYTNADRIYRISRDFRNPELRLAANAPVVAALLKEDFPQIEQAARLYCCGNVVLSRDQMSFFSRAQLADNEIFEIFDFKWLQGDPRHALAEPFTIVLTRTAARTYFGDADPMGQFVTIENKWPMKVTGVIEDLPTNTHLQFDALISLLTAPRIFGESFVQGWSSNNFHTYVLLEPGADIEDIQRGSAAFFERHMGEGSSLVTGFKAFALTDIHLRSDRQFEMKPGGNIAVVYAFGAVAAFILLSACINFMNLATARCTTRAKEVGVRKAIGASQGQLIRQFLGEAVLLAFIAVLLAVALVELALPHFRTFLQLDLAFDYLEHPEILVLLAALALFVGLLAGSYPAFYLSAFQPARVLKGDVSRGTGAATLRKGLVVLQFAISIGLIIGTAVVYQQTVFARNIDPGFNKELLVVIENPTTEGPGDKWRALKHALLQHPRILEVSGSRLVPPTPLTDTYVIRAEGGDPSGFGMTFNMVDEDFFKTYQLGVLAGRGFSEDFPADRLIIPTEKTPHTSPAFVLSEMAARKLGWTPEEAIGKWFEVSFGSRFSRSARGPIVGVVRDAHFESLRSPIKPLFYMLAPDMYGGFPAIRQITIRISGQNVAGTLEDIRSMWQTFAPARPFRHYFLDDQMAALYASEQRQAQVFGYFTVLAIFIACLGLFGLASFTTERRIKEIGVRKVMGASVWDIVRLFTTDFTKLVLLANLLAWPVAFMLMQRWLSSFAYRIDMSPFVYVAAALLALLVAWLTVGSVAARAADSKPIRSLRYE